jgi:hypothetical protein
MVIGDTGIIISVLSRVKAENRKILIYGRETAGGEIRDRPVEGIQR